MAHSHALRTFVAALIWASVFAAIALLWILREAVLIALGAVLSALLLALMAEQITRWTHLPRRLALLASVLAIVAVCILVVWLFGSQVSGQIADVFARVQNAERQIRQMLDEGQLSPIAQRLVSGGGDLVSAAVAHIASMTLSAIEGTVIIVISAIYLAEKPELYRKGLIELFPPRMHRWAGNTADVMGASLRLWLLGQLLLMLITGVLSFVAAWAIGLPSPIGLGVIAGLANLIPYIGPFIGGIPAVLVAFTLGVWPAVWTVVAYLGIHLVEGYLAAPLIQERFVKIPPAVMLIGITAASLIFGFVGVVFAAPLTVAIFVVVKLIYVRETLDEPTDLPGEDGGRD